MRNIRENLFFAFVYNTSGAPIAAGAARAYSPRHGIERKLRGGQRLADRLTTEVTPAFLQLTASDADEHFNVSRQPPDEFERHAMLMVAAS